jgi:hypothetical protein
LLRTEPLFCAAAIDGDERNNTTQLGQRTAVHHQTPTAVPTGAILF